MRTVWKYPVQLTGGPQELHVPTGAEIIHVDYDGRRELCLWALVDADNDKEWREFKIVGTGHPEVDPETDHYVGTVINLGFVWHVFEVRR
jgi:hypothetical protein